MGRRKALEDIGRKLLSRSAVAVGREPVNGVLCREWGGAINPRGYGRVWDGVSLQYAHRLAWGVWVGPVPEGLDVCHRCDNPACIEVAHLWCGTHQENIADRGAKGRTRNGADKIRGLPNTWSRGSRHGLAKLDEDGAREIKQRLRVGWRPTVLAREYGVSDSLVRGIKAGRNWGWLSEDGIVNMPPARPAPVPPLGLRKYAINDPRRPKVVGKKLKEALRGSD